MTKCRKIYYRHLAQSFIWSL